MPTSSRLSSRKLGELKPLHPPGMNQFMEEKLRDLTDSELLKAVTSPADGQFLKVRPGDNALIDGNTRFHEMQRRMKENPGGLFNEEFEVPVEEIPRPPIP